VLLLLLSADMILLCCALNALTINLSMNEPSFLSLFTVVCIIICEANSILLATIQQCIFAMIMDAG